MTRVSASYATDAVLGHIWRVPRNAESWLITGLILFLIISPVSTVPEAIMLFMAGVIASGSKFILAWRGKHLFNPAAFAAAVLSLTAVYPASWWVGSTRLWPFTLIIGLVVVRKIRRFPLVLSFVLVSIVLQAALFIIVTAWKVGPLYIYPEVALLLGNVYAYIVSPKFRVRLQLKEIQKISDRVYNYVFMPDRQFKFLPGQYMEWTLAGVPFDSRGNRRTLTIASSPTEREVHLGLKYYNPPSMYKYTFSKLKPGDWLYASQIAGNFTLNGNERKKLAFIAGGIGITPFRSMVKYLTDTNQQFDAVLLYVVTDPTEFAYVREFQAAVANGLKFIPIVTQPNLAQSNMVTGKLSPELISQLVPDHGERLFYVSGPRTMVDGTKSYVRQLGVYGQNIKTDHFSGY
jgi:ferredoxin-NADP reductase